MIILQKGGGIDMQANQNFCETSDLEQAEKGRDYFVPLIRRICGSQTTSQIFERVFRKEKVLYDWLRVNPNADKNEIRRKSHEIAGTLSEYEATIEKRFYVIEPYRRTAEQFFYCGSWSFVETMILGSNLMLSAIEIANEMPMFSKSRNEYIGVRIDRFVDMLSKYGIAWEADQMISADVSGMDAEGIVALIICATWKNRLFPNTLKPFIKNGIILQWLDRLAELDK